MCFDVRPRHHGVRTCTMIGEATFEFSAVGCRDGDRFRLRSESVPDFADQVEAFVRRKTGNFLGDDRVHERKVGGGSDFKQVN